MSDNSWYERGELPPVDSVVEFSGFDEACCLEHEVIAAGQHVTIQCHFKAQACYVAGFTFKGEFGEIFISQAKAGFFRPLKSDRDKAIDAAHDYLGLIENDFVKHSLGKLYDAGLLRLPD